MKLLVEIAAGLAACGAAYYLARPDSSPTVTESARREGAAVESTSRSAEASPLRRAMDAPRVRLTTADAGPSAEEQRAMATLRNEVIVAASADMQRRGENVMTCLAGVQFAGAQKLRFSVDVVATPQQATTGTWRFVEIVDGEPLPESFAACAARALGGEHQLVPPKSFTFPSFRGALEILYTIPAPRSD